MPDHLPSTAVADRREKRRRPPPHPWRDLGCAAEDLFDFVGRLLRGDDEAIGGTAGATDDAIDVLVARHRVGPLLASRMSGAPWSTRLAPATAERIRRAHARQAAVAKRCLELLDAIDVECRRARLPFLVVKGPAMAMRSYGDVAARGYWDLDVMVREADRPRMEVVLGRIGALRLSRVPLGAAVSARFSHAFDYESGGVKLDLHWCMTRLPGVRCDDAGAFARAESLDLAGRNVRVLSVADELHFLLVSAFADIQRGRLRLQTCIDIWTLLRRAPPIDWARFFALREGERTDRICRETLRTLLASLRLDDTVPDVVAAVGGCPSPEAARRILLPSAGGLRGKYWAVSALPAGLVGYAGWWCVSLPFRVAASHPAWRRGA